MFVQAYLLAGAVILVSAQQQGSLDRTRNDLFDSTGVSIGSGSDVLDPYRRSDRDIGMPYSDPYMTNRRGLENRQGITGQLDRPLLSRLDGLNGLLGRNQMTRFDPYNLGDGMMTTSDSRTFGFDRDGMDRQRMFSGGSRRNLGNSRIPRYDPDVFDRNQRDGMADRFLRGNRLSDSSGQLTGSTTDNGDFLSEFLRGRPFRGDSSLLDLNVLSSETNLNDLRGSRSRRPSGLLSQTTSSLLPGMITENLPLDLLRGDSLLDLNLLSRKTNINDFGRPRPRMPPQTMSSMGSDRRSLNSFDDRFQNNRNRFMDGLTGFPRRREDGIRRSTQFMNSMNMPRRGFDMMRSMPRMGNNMDMMRSSGMRQNRGRFTDQMRGRNTDGMMQNNGPRFQSTGTQDRTMTQRPADNNQMDGTMTSGTETGGILNVI
ncbi:uncharacterized protein LOC133198645 [Saccostrea echinata]|uniref:uncharacterized protein LOC133198645 n=1 Tax=Saccostrea echinata TaxID=191078 RepID=UPI002A815956|nr:uncharacterized protein LOC133198645 [Saccostrea echinata]